MKKKLIFLLSILLVATGIVGCQKNNSTKLSTQNTKFAVKGTNFVGVQTGKGTVKSPSYKYYLYLNKNGEFVQSRIATKGDATVSTQKGTYSISKKGIITLKTVAIFDEKFGSSQEIRAQKSPVSVVERTTETLSPTEKRSVKVLKKKGFLQPSTTNVKLYPTKKAPQNYDKYRKNEQAKFDNSYAHFAGHGFTSNGMDTPMNSIAFKDNKFIWTYGNTSTAKDHDVMSVFEGTYSVDKNIVTLNITAKSARYYGNLLFLFGNVYKQKEAPFSANQIKLKYHPDSNSLDVIGNPVPNVGMQDMHPEDGAASYPQYSDHVAKYGVNVIGQKMQLKRQKSVEEIFPTKQDFEDWVLQNYEVALNEPEATEDEPGFHVLGVDHNGRVDVRETMDPSTMHEANPIYVMAYSLTQYEVDGMAPYMGVAIMADGRLYSGHFLAYDKKLTAAYKEYSEVR